MDFELNEAQRLLKDVVLNYARKEIGPLVEEMEERGQPPPHLFPDL